ncbi:nucleotidyltransferase [Halorubrum ezzemoulense]|uniref:nucleotidyltransferase n=1 Tax=Halorubrum ezzemoulense TaxID=337243 RepID=UPI00232AAEF4|nr:nucleotidyltransferase [Halorubrum ezzemoulense]MDB9281592.1 nucleotidyltransferase [Halorubrum ezzemoulense]MDB9284926.1 nucleotidyltransferase [Halorubrum ezzemoulense]
MSREPTFESSAIRRQFSELANLIDDDFTVYLIGGGALTLEGLKNATKDIDLIVREESELRQLWNVLTSAGYKPKEDLGEEYDELGAAFILEKDHRRFDVFHEQVAGVISLSDSMVSRSRHLFEEDGLSVRMVSLNDIFLFKAVANREDDVEDMVRIAQAGIEDDVVVEEIMSQLDLLGSDDFIGAMKQKLERLEDRGFVFDIHDEVNELYDRSQDGSKVRNAIVSLREHEYDDDLYTGVPESALERQLGEETTTSGVEWLLRISDLHRESDGSLVLVT